MVVLVLTAYTIGVYIQAQSPAKIDIKLEIILVLIASASIILAWLIIWAYLHDSRDQHVTGWLSLRGWGVILLDLLAWLFGGTLLFFSQHSLQNTEKRISNCSSLGPFCGLQVRSAINHSYKFD